MGKQRRTWGQDPVIFLRSAKSLLLLVAISNHSFILQSAAGKEAKDAPESSEVASQTPVRQSFGFIPRSRCSHPSAHSHFPFRCGTCARRGLQTKCSASGDSRTGGDKVGQRHQRAFKLIVSASGSKLTYLKLFGEHPQGLFPTTATYIIDLMGWFPQNISSAQTFAL